MSSLRRWLVAASTGALLFTAAASADVLYTWTDASGRVQYSDQPPKNFAGPVRQIEIDAKPAEAAPAAKPPDALPAKAPGAKGEPHAEAPPKGDVATTRRATRERLQRELDVARERLAAARKALAEHPEPGVEERQVVQRTGVATASRMNCRTQERDGKKITICPVAAPTEAYFDRIDKLEADVRRAEEDVATAERAYRRGVD